MTSDELQAAARAKLNTPQTDTFVDPMQPTALPIVLHRVVPKVARPAMATYVLEAFQETFTIIYRNRRIMFTNYRYETDDAAVADGIISEHAPRVWRMQDGHVSTAG